ncbi:hypothetical protein HPB51_025819 [Rhipicephalus microplus]|uniref:Uncharacterized protein n=1 Tax=Rhipicephalus microplus TaxID=6941 RepID=A0A9J6EK01_RHIMP|nr:hypothetical protein HPB51_025819 [Rhipicephalus microplus]
MVAALQLTTKKQREHIRKQNAISKGFQRGDVHKVQRQQEAEDKMATEEPVTAGRGESQAAHNPNSRATQAVRSRPQSRAVAVAATRGIALQSDDEKVSDSEVEDIEEDDDSLSTATRLESRESASRLVGYAGFSNRLTRLEHTYKKWDKNLEAMEQRIIQRCTELMQEQMAQQL